MMVVPFLPASGIVKLGFVIAERVLYIPSIGFCMIIAQGVKHLCWNVNIFKKVYYLFERQDAYYLNLDLFAVLEDILWSINYGNGIKNSSSC